MIDKRVQGQNADNQKANAIVNVLTTNILNFVDDSIDQHFKKGAIKPEKIKTDEYYVRKKKE